MAGCAHQETAVEGLTTLPLDSVVGGPSLGGVGIESGESEPSDVFESEDPVDSSETEIEGTEGTSWGVGGSRYEDKLEEI